MIHPASRSDALHAPPRLHVRCACLHYWYVPYNTATPPSHMPRRSLSLPTGTSATSSVSGDALLALDLTAGPSASNLVLLPGLLPLGSMHPLHCSALHVSRHHLWPTAAADTLRPPAAPTGYVNFFVQYLSLHQRLSMQVNKPNILEEFNAKKP